jgi:hypothetical protein
VVLLKENHRPFTKASTLNRKSGGEPRDLRFAFGSHTDVYWVFEG